MKIQNINLLKLFKKKKVSVIQWDSEELSGDLMLNEPSLSSSFLTCDSNLPPLLQDCEHFVTRMSQHQPGLTLLPHERPCSPGGGSHGHPPPPHHLARTWVLLKLPFRLLLPGLSPVGPAL